jgi:DNA-binding transcriptional MerR regulator
MSKNAEVASDSTDSLPSIPAKRYFTIGEVSDLCAVKPHVLRYWEQEFSQLKPIKRRGNRRYYQHHEVLLIRRIRELLYEEGFTINGARNRLDGNGAGTSVRRRAIRDEANASSGVKSQMTVAPLAQAASTQTSGADAVDQMRTELESIRALLSQRSEQSAQK